MSLQPGKPVIPMLKNPMNTIGLCTKTNLEKNLSPEENIWEEAKLIPVCEPITCRGMPHQEIEEFSCGKFRYAATYLKDVSNILTSFQSSYIHPTIKMEINPKGLLRIIPEPQHEHDIVFLLSPRVYA